MPMTQSSTLAATLSQLNTEFGRIKEPLNH